MHAWKAFFVLLLGFFGSDGADPIDANRESDPLDPTQSFFVAPDPPSDDPAHYTLDPLFGPRFVDRIHPKARGGRYLKSRRLPRHAINPLGTLRDRANPFRGHEAPVIAGAAVRTRFYEDDPDARLASNGGWIVPVNPLDPTPAFDPVYLPLIESTPATDNSGTPYLEADRVIVLEPIPSDQVARQQAILDELPGTPLLALTESPVTQTDGPFDLFDIFAVQAEAQDGAGNPLDLPDKSDDPLQPTSTQAYYIPVDPGVDPDSLVGTKLKDSEGMETDRVIWGISQVIPQFVRLIPDLKGDAQNGFGGDYSGIVAFFPGADPNGNFPNGPACDADDRTHIRDAFRCPNGVEKDGRSNSTQNIIDGVQVADGLIPLRNTSITGGAGELPLRPAPDLSMLDPNPGLRDAQGLYIPSAGQRRALQNGGPKKPKFVFERNVDLATGRPLVTRFAEGDAGPQTEGGCDTPSSGSTPVEIVDGATPVALPFDASKSWRSSSARGIGIDEPCLKAGGAAGFQAENDFFGAENALEHHSANQQLFASLCSATIGGTGFAITTFASAVAVSFFDRCALDIFGSPSFLQGGVAPFPLVEFYSIAFSGEPVSQAFIIAFTDSVRSRGDERGKPAPLVALNRDRGPICDPDTGAPFVTPAHCVAALQAGGWDGIITARAKQINTPNPAAPTSVPFFNPGTGLTETLDCTRTSGLKGGNDGPCRVFSFHYDPGVEGSVFVPGDSLTLDSTLTNEQKALLGCGPFFGTRCDSADAVASFDAGTGEEDDAPLIPAGGGIDPLNTDAGAFFHAWAGASKKDRTPELRAAFDTAEQERVDTLIPACRDNNGPPLQPSFCRRFYPLVDVGGTSPVPYRLFERLKATSLTTATSVLPPQTIRLSDGATAGKHPPGCGVFDEAEGTIRILPGCRGIRSIDVTTDTGGIPTLFTVRFDEGFLPSVDGCPFGSTGGDQTLDIGGVPVDTRASDGTPVSGRLATELASCADDSTLAQNSNSRVHDYTLNVGTRERVGAPVAGAQALFHPVAGCLPDEDAASLDRRRNVCPFGLVAGEEPRDFAAELAGADPSGRGPENVFLFRSEVAALSFNLQMVLATSSCNGDAEEAIMQDSLCFDPEDSFSPARCSFAAPQLCRDVRGFFALSGLQRDRIRGPGPRKLDRRAFLWHGSREKIRRGRRH